MKKRLTRKLFLSLAALGVTAATLSTSTFAWYTYNAEAEVNQIKAETEAKGESSIFISSAKTFDDTYGTIAATWENYGATMDVITTGYTFGTSKLKPVYSNFGTITKEIGTSGSEGYKAAVEGRAYNMIDSSTAHYVKATGNYVEGTVYYTDDKGTSKVDTSEYTTSQSVANFYTRDADVVSYKNDDKTSYLEFVLRVRTSNTVAAAGQNLYFSKFELAADQSNASQVALAKGEGTGVNANTYSANLLNALKLDVTSASVTLNSDGSIPDEGSTTRIKNTNEVNTVKTYGFENLVDQTDDDTKDVGISTANAVGYYNTVMGKNLVTPESHTEIAVGKRTKTGDTLSAIPANNEALVVATLTETPEGKPFSVVEIRFVLYLDGWDNYCYDIMQNQDVTFSFALTTQASESILYKPTTA